MWPRQLHIYVTFGILISKKASLLKFRYCEKTTKFGKKISDLILKLFRNVKTKWEIFTNFCGLLKTSELSTGVKYAKTWKKIYQARFSFVFLFLTLIVFQRANLFLSLCFGEQWYFVTKIVLTYCEKKLF